MAITVIPIPPHTHDAITFRLFFFFYLFFFPFTRMKKSLITLGTLAALVPAAAFAQEAGIHDQGIIDAAAALDIKDLAMGFAMSIGAIGPAIGIGIIGGNACAAIGRNPEAAPRIQTAMILTAAFAEAVAIYSLVVALIIKFV